MRESDRMDIGVGLPMKALEADELAEFAHTIESGPFASLSLGDRLAYECHDVLTALAYVAASVVGAPYDRSGGLVAGCLDAENEHLFAQTHSI